VWYEHGTPPDLLRRTALAGYAEITGELLLQVARRYARSGHIGVLLASSSSTSRLLHGNLPRNVPSRLSATTAPRCPIGRRVDLRPETGHRRNFAETLRKATSAASGAMLGS